MAIFMETLLTPEEVAKILNVSEFKVKELLRKKVLIGGKVGGVWRVKPADLQDYLNSFGNQPNDKK